MRRAEALSTALLVLTACGVPPGPPPPPPPGEGLQVNDVSYLYPLPASAAGADQLLRFDSSGAQGALFSRTFFNQVKAIDEDLTLDQIYPRMRIISARVDHCFPGNKPTQPLQCRKQIRLVGQVVEEKDGKVTTRDGTIHLFYDLSDAQFDAAVAKVWALKELAGANSNGPLGVHPVMKTQGLQGAYATALNQLILDFCGDTTLSRVAFMISARTGDAWTFGAFIRQANTLEPDPIPRLSQRNEQGVRENGAEESRAGEMLPTPPNDDLSTLLSQTELRLADEFTLKQAVKQALKIENVDKETPMSIDCASCHVASRALSNAVAVRNIDLSTFAERWQPAEGYDARRTDQAANNPFAQRAFGYFNDQSALSQRTINESVAVAAHLNQNRQ